MKPFEDRAKAALEGRCPRAADVQKLIAELDEMTAELGRQISDLRDGSRDPATPSDAAREAKRSADDLEFDSERLGSMRERLVDRLGRLKASEEDRARAHFYREVSDENAAIAAALRERVPAILDELVGLLARIQANDARLQEANAQRPNGAPGLMSAEFVARGSAGQHWRAGGPEPVARLINLKLPRFDGPGQLWPPDPRAGLAAIFQQQRAHYIADLEYNSPAAVARRKADDDKRYVLYAVSQAHYAGHPIGPVAHRGGAAMIYDNPSRLEMDLGQVREARAQGMIVELAPADAEAAA